ncbi:hypothetical protein ACFX2H_013823 [Malus domestica]
MAKVDSRASSAIRRGCQSARKGRQGHTKEFDEDDGNSWTHFVPPKEPPPARLTPHFPKPRQPQVRQQQQQINQLHKQQFSMVVARNKTPTTSNGSVYSDHLPSTSSFATLVEKEHNMWNEVRSRLLLIR